MSEIKVSTINLLYSKVSFNDKIFIFYSVVMDMNVQKGYRHGMS